MFRYSTEYASALWSTIERFTLLHPYKILQGQVAETYATYADVVKRYSEAVKRTISPLTKEYLDEHPEVADQNVALLKNSIELWRTARSTTDAVSPLLYHYSWHCLNSFFAYTLFQWEPQHSSSHGVTVILKDKLEDIQIRISHTEKSLFQRLIDTWTLLAVPLAFSPLLPMVKNEKLDFAPNKNYLPERAVDGSWQLSLPKLLAFDPTKFENDLYSQDAKRELPSCRGGFSSPNATLKGYLVFFVASTLARYRPVKWHSILAGETSEESDFASHSHQALQQCTVGGTTYAEGFLAQINSVFNDIEERRFKLSDGEGKILK
jgi:hypothetical protein